MVNPTDRARFRTRLFSWLAILPVLVFIGSVVTAIATRSAKPAVQGFMVLATYSAWLRARRVRWQRTIAQATGEQALAADPRPPVVYLRPFGADDSSGEMHGEYTQEEQLASVLRDFGSVIAIRNPDEKLPHAGFARLEAAPPEWQDRVRELLGRGRLIVVRAGVGPGLQWETLEVRKRVNPERVLLVADGWRSLAHTLRALQVERGCVKSSLWRIGDLRFFVLFDPEWTARSVPVRRRPLRAYERATPLAGKFRMTLQPLYTALGERWVRPRTTAEGIVLMVLMVLVPTVAVSVVILNRLSQ